MDFINAEENPSRVFINVNRNGRSFENKSGHKVFIFLVYVLVLAILVPFARFCSSIRILMGRLFWIKKNWKKFGLRAWFRFGKLFCELEPIGSVEKGKSGMLMWCCHIFIRIFDTFHWLEHLCRPGKNGNDRGGTDWLVLRMAITEGNLTD